MVFISPDSRCNTRKLLFDFFGPRPTWRACLAEAVSYHMLPQPAGLAHQLICPRTPACFTGRLQPGRGATEQLLSMTLAGRDMVSATSSAIPVSRNGVCPQNGYFHGIILINQWVSQMYKTHQNTTCSEHFWKLRC